MRLWNELLKEGELPRVGCSPFIAAEIIDREINTRVV